MYNKQIIHSAMFQFRSGLFFRSNRLIKLMLIVSQRNHIFTLLFEDNTLCTLSPKYYSIQIFRHPDYRFHKIQTIPFSGR